MEDNSKGGVYWKDVFHEIYTQLPHTYGPGKKGWDDEHLLAKKLKISGNELFLSIDFLMENRLLETHQGDDYIHLSKKGFDVAFQNEKLLEGRKMQQERQVVLYGEKLFIISNFIKKSLWSIITREVMSSPRFLQLRKSLVNQLSLKIGLPRRTNYFVRLLPTILQY